MENAKPVFKKPFSRSTVVVCGFCKGRGHTDGIECNYCRGIGTLLEVRSGNLELFENK